MPRPNFLLHEIPWSLKTFQNRLSQEPSSTCSQLFYGKYIRRPSFYSFLTVFWILSGRIRRRIFFKCHVWISSYSVNRVGEKDNLRVFSLSRSTWRFQMKIKYFPIEIGIFQREIWKNIRLRLEQLVCFSRALQTSHFMFFRRQRFEIECIQ